jgi:F-type H+-transporting ATPase subunit epsilon
MPFAFEVVSPERLLLATQAELAEIPAEEGDIGVLAGHAPMIVTLRGGVIRITEAGGAIRQFFVAGGFAEITPNRTAVLADEAVPLDELSRDAAAARIAEAEAAYAAAAEADPATRDAALRRVLAARAMADAATR